VVDQNGFGTSIVWSICHGGNEFWTEEEHVLSR